MSAYCKVSVKRILGNEILLHPIQAMAQVFIVKYCMDFYKLCIYWHRLPRSVVVYECALVWAIKGSQSYLLMHYELDFDSPNGNIEKYTSKNHES